MTLIDGDEVYESLASRLQWLMNFGDDIYISVGDDIRETMYSQEIYFDLARVTEQIKEVGKQYCKSVGCDNNCYACDEDTMVYGEAMMRNKIVIQYDAGHGKEIIIIKGKEKVELIHQYAGQVIISNMPNNVVAEEEDIIVNW